MATSSRTILAQCAHPTATVNEQKVKMVPPRYHLRPNFVDAGGFVLLDEVGHVRTSLIKLDSLETLVASG